MRFKEKVAEFHRWRKNETEYLSLFVTVLNFLGLWTDKTTKYGQPSQFGKALTLTWVLIPCPFFIYIAFVSSYKNRKNGDTIMNVLEPALTGCVIIVFILYTAIMRFNGQRFTNALSALKYMLECGRKLEEHPADLVRKAKKFAELCVIYYVGGCAPFVFAGSGLIAMAYTTKKFVFKAWFPYNFKSHPYFDLTTVAINLTVVLGFNLILVVNGFLMLHLAHMIGQFKLLNYNLTRLNQKTRKQCKNERILNKKEVLKSLLERREMTLHEKNHPKVLKQSGSEYEVQTIKKDYRQLGKIYSSKFGVLTKHEHLLEPRPFTFEEIEHRFKLCAQHHQSILVCIQKFQPAFDLIMLIQFFMSVTPTILTIVLVTSMKELDVKLALFALPLSASIFNQWLYCWLGQKITTESDLIRNAVFASKWFAMSSRFKRSMRIMIAMSSKPLVIVVGRLLPLSLESFYAVMKLSYTSYMSLKEVQGQLLSPDEILTQEEKETTH